MAHDYIKQLYSNLRSAVQSGITDLANAQQRIRLSTTPGSVVDPFKAQSEMLETLERTRTAIKFPLEDLLKTTEPIPGIHPIQYELHMELLSFSYEKIINSPPLAEDMLQILNGLRAYTARIIELPEQVSDKTPREICPVNPNELH